VTSRILALITAWRSLLPVRRSSRKETKTVHKDGSDDDQMIASLVAFLVMGTSIMSELIFFLGSDDIANELFVDQLNSTTMTSNMDIVNMDIVLPEPPCCGEKRRIS